MAGQRIAVMFPALILSERRGIFNDCLSISVYGSCGADVLRGCGGLLAHLRFLGLRRCAA
nr:MAG TPA: hypothetical protein [Caudoviricetes sp.]